ncbi:hypothetical protein B0H17DRAFT_1193841 [Mycena rosella]|uniref:Uncharacterized protein n=1 Tax=Mycena rosella TaxID=1033263 RepID=A0AAD7GRU2_MYCRO|nr:hypothetical protein B0H17DRAFT_1193841 [Mycena rosella]
MLPFHVRKVEAHAATSASETPGLETIVDVLARAFSIANDFTAIMTGHRPDSPESSPLVWPLCRSTATVGLLGGEVYVAEMTTGTTRIVGCAMWFGPTCMLYDS